MLEMQFVKSVPLYLSMKYECWVC